MTATMTDTTRRSKKLYKDPTDKMIAGVASGVAKYLDIDTTLMRVLWASSVVFGGFGIIAYVLLWLILDDEPAPEPALSPTADEPLAEDSRSEPDTDREPSEPTAASNEEIPLA